MYEFKPIQREAAVAIHTNLFKRGHSKTLVSLSTGWGKTILASKLFEMYSQRYGLRCLFLVDRVQLLEQTQKSFMDASNMEASIEQANNMADLDALVTIGSMQTISKPERLSRFSPTHFDFIVIDEAQGALSESYEVIMDHFVDAKYLFMTATADKLVDKGLFDIVDSVSYEFTLPQSVAAGMNCRPVLKNMTLEGVDLAALAESEDKLELIIPKIAEALQDVCMDKKTIVFLPSIERSKSFADRLNKTTSLKAFHIDGSMVKGAKRKVLKEFKESGLGSILVNPILLGTGFDDPSIDCVAVLRNIGSRALYSQMVGRALRIAPGKEKGTILDFLGLSQKHNITASIDELSRGVCAFVPPEGSGIEIDLISGEREVMNNAENVLAEKIALMAQKENGTKKKYFSAKVYLKTMCESVVFVKDGLPMTMAHAEALNSAGISVKGVETAENANKIIDIITKRNLKNLATVAQVAFLKWKGIHYAHNMDAKTAGETLGKLNS